MLPRVHRRPLLFLTLLCVASALLVQLMVRQRQQTRVPTGNETGITLREPARLRIPRLAIDAPIVPTGITDGGRMAVPKRGDEVGWYRLGSLPGERGSAVLAGHLDTARGGPAVFWRLHELEQGDILSVVDKQGREQQFRVMRSEIYDEAHSPLELIFGAGSGHFLNLITCNGVWLEHKRLYDKRLVVFTELTKN